MVFMIDNRYVSDENSRYYNAYSTQVKYVGEQDLDDLKERLNLENSRPTELSADNIRSLRDVGFYGTKSDDVLIDLSLGKVVGRDGEDTILAYSNRFHRPNSSTQSHIYGGKDSDYIYLAMQEISADERLDQGLKVHVHGHHAFGDGDNEFYADTFNFIYTDYIKENMVLVGRIDDFDYESDRLQYEGEDIDLKNLPRNMRIVEYAEDRMLKAGYGEQQFLLIETKNGGYILEALEGYRIIKDGKGNSDMHFLRSRDTIDDPNNKDGEFTFLDLPSVQYEDPHNIVPLAEYENNIRRYNIISSVYEKNDQVEIYGGYRHDISNGTNKIDKIYGGNGDDLLAGNVNHDELYGDRGDDGLWGGSDNDTLYGGSGGDRLFGGTGDDYLEDYNGRDEFYGGGGSDTISYRYWWKTAERGSKTLEVNLKTGENNSYDKIQDVENIDGSEFHNNHLIGDDQANILRGYDYDDELYGGAGADSLVGRGGSDYLNGGAGNDKMWGGAGDDVFFINARDGVDRIYDLETGKGARGHDIIRLDIKDYNRFSDVVDIMKQQGRDVFIDFGSGHNILIDNTKISEMNADMFEFV